MRDQDLSVELIEGATTLDPPSPSARQDLQPFLNCYEILAGRAQADFGQGESTNRLNRYQSLNLGSWAFKRSSEVEWGSQTDSGGEGAAAEGVRVSSLDPGG